MEDRSLPPTRADLDDPEGRQNERHDMLRSEMQTASKT